MTNHQVIKISLSFFDLRLSVNGAKRNESRVIGIDGSVSNSLFLYAKDLNVSGMEKNLLTKVQRTPQMFKSSEDERGGCLLKSNGGVRREGIDPKAGRIISRDENPLQQLEIRFPRKKK
ncbi:hypothetical protein CCACVL1_28305 [Corchorus capsularis]|uniref:Uncharacterized protein n=1 Tax=Corchorus capsularis TaxID=210143 RepID=A0A1R3G6W6_COCAP|nr:hypothetical protein CCACVL1_28305 [Corchorus capsularis]